MPDTFIQRFMYTLLFNGGIMRDEDSNLALYTFVSLNMWNLQNGKRDKIMAKKRTNNDLQNIGQKTKDLSKTNLTKNRRVNSGEWGGGGGAVKWL